MEDFHALERLEAMRPNYVMLQTLGGVNQAFDNEFSIDRAYSRGLYVERVQDENLFDRFPAAVAVEPGTRKSKVLLDANGFEQAVDLLKPIAAITPDDVYRLYLGGGVVMDLLRKAMPQREEYKIDRIYTILSSVDSLATAIRCSGDFNEQERYDAALSLMQSDEARLCRINGLRFMTGVIIAGEAARGNEDFGDCITAASRVSLLATLGRKSAYVRTIRALGPSEEEAEKLFAEQVSELELALSFPMSRSEVDTIWNIATKYSDPTVPSVEEL